MYKFKFKNISSYRPFIFTKEQNLKWFETVHKGCSLGKQLLLGSQEDPYGENPSGEGVWCTGRSRARAEDAAEVCRGSLEPSPLLRA